LSPRATVFSTLAVARSMGCSSMSANNNGCLRPLLAVLTLLVSTLGGGRAACCWCCFSFR
jgi:hypothetical protein